MTTSYNFPGRLPYGLGDLPAAPADGLDPGYSSLPVPMISASSQVRPGIAGLNVLPMIDRDVVEDRNDDDEFSPWSFGGGFSLPQQGVAEPQIIEAQFGRGGSRGGRNPAALIPYLLKMLPEKYQLQVTPDSGAGRDAELERCKQAAKGSKAGWVRFCDSIGVDENAVLGGGSARQACLGKTEESKVAKVNWCLNQYGN
jgi:hypothetical protein